MARLPLGAVELRSGTLVVIDFGCMSLLGVTGAEVKAALDTALVGDATEVQVGGLTFVVVRGLPSGRFEVTSELFDEGPDVGMRRDAIVTFAEGVTAKTVPLGTMLVDKARVGLFDREALSSWNELEPSDGLADVAFWGRDTDEVARRFNAGRIAEGVHGRENLPTAEAIAMGEQLEALRNSGELRFAFDYRPHTPPFHLLAQMRSSEGQSGVLQLGGLTVCGFMTTWGDGWFPVTLEVDASGRALRLRIEFAEEDPAPVAN
jgi:hypothetical protein